MRYFPREYDIDLRWGNSQLRISTNLDREDRIEVLGEFRLSRAGGVSLVHVEFLSLVLVQLSCGSLIIA